MSDLFLLGAGFSRAVSTDMPLMADLVGPVFKNNQLLDNAEDDFDFPNHFEAFGSDFEAWLTYLAEDHPWLSDARNLRNRADFLNASRRLGSEILQRENSVLESHPPSWLAQIVDYWHTTRATVLTLNYDCLVEKAFSEPIRQPPGSRVHYEALYPVPVSDVALRRAGVYGGKDIATFKLVKLHGSVNWCYSGSPSFYGETIYHLGYKLGWHADPPGEIEQRAPDKIPLIVPPTLSKTSFFNNETVRSQWQLARRALATAQRLFCIGYSLPPSDQMIRFFLRSARRGLTIFPVNTDRRIGARYREALPGTIAVDGRYGGGAAAVQRFVSEICQPPATAPVLPT
jgi:hypothetical protein